MKLVRTLACGAATLCLAACAVPASESSSSPSGQGATSNPSLDEEETLILLEPMQAKSLYGVDEDGDGLVDYLVIEGPDTLAHRSEESDEVQEGE